MDFWPVFIKMVELFCIIIIGFIANKCGILKADAKALLTKIVLNITLPCTILSSVMNSDNLPGLSKIGYILLIAFLTYVLYFFVAKATSFILRLEGERKGIVEFALIFSNVGFVGYPVTQAIFGPDALFYTCVFNMPFNVLCYSAGVALLKGGKERKDGDTSGESSQILKWAKLILTPSMIASIIALAMAMCATNGPKIIGNITQMLGDMTTPAALLIIGSALADMPLKNMLTDYKAYIVAIVSVVITPLAAYLVFSPISGGDHLLLGDAVVISGMPVATAGTMLCVEHGCDEQFMAQLTFISTVLSVVSIPLFAAVV